jgi:glycosyltransferase involved in cell wall biosynthesis
MDHGVDFERFSEADADPTVPDDLRDVPRPIIGFFGGIDDHTFDLDFMARVAAMRPQYSFVFVGRTSIDCTPMTRLPNVTMLGQRPYDQIPRYGRCFDVCLMPWRQNRWIEACNPIKLREYLALGKPIVSTPFPELESWGDAAYVASSSGEFALAIDRALADRSPGLIEKQRQRVASASWLGRARHLLEVLTSSSTASAA